MIRVIQQASNIDTDSGATTTITLSQPTQARSLIVVMSTNSDDRATTSIVDNSPSGSSPYVDVAISHLGLFHNHMSYTANSKGGATTITITLAGTAASIVSWAFEAQGLNSSSPLMQFATIDNAATTLDPLGAAVTTTEPLCLLLCLEVVQRTITSVDAPWTIGIIAAGNADAYLITTYSGINTYQPQFHQTPSGTYSSITAAFREAPHSTDIRGAQIGLNKPSILIPAYDEG